VASDALVDGFAASSSFAVLVPDLAGIFLDYHSCSAVQSLARRIPVLA
jgi:hypothetical protein